jgi:hypothetical protein
MVLWELIRTTASQHITAFQACHSLLAFKFFSSCLYIPPKTPLPYSPPQPAAYTAAGSLCLKRGVGAGRIGLGNRLWAVGMDFELSRDRIVASQGVMSVGGWRGFIYRNSATVLYCDQCDGSGAISKPF